MQDQILPFIAIVLLPISILLNNFLRTSFNEYSDNLNLNILNSVYYFRSIIGLWLIYYVIHFE